MVMTTAVTTTKNTKLWFLGSCFVYYKRVQCLGPVESLCIDWTLCAVLRCLNGTHCCGVNDRKICRHKKSGQHTASDWNEPARNRSSSQTLFLTTQKCAGFSAQSETEPRTTIIFCHFISMWSHNNSSVLLSGWPFMARVSPFSFITEIARRRRRRWWKQKRSTQRRITSYNDLLVERKITLRIFVATKIVKRE